jgi:hypothetical protein
MSMLPRVSSLSFPASTGCITHCREGNKDNKKVGTTPPVRITQGVPHEVSGDGTFQLQRITHTGNQGETPVESIVPKQYRKDAILYRPGDETSDYLVTNNTERSLALASYFIQNGIDFSFYGRKLWNDEQLKRLLARENQTSQLD